MHPLSNESLQSTGELRRLAALAIVGFARNSARTLDDSSSRITSEDRMPTSARLSQVPATEAHLVLALVSVNGFTAACAEHGDRATLGVLSEYYAAVAASVRASGGRVVKVMGDGMLLAFSAAETQVALAALRSAQQEGNRLWQAFDARCGVAVRVSAGSVLVGTFGPPGDERPDLFGDALNQLFKSPTGPFVLTPQVEALLR